MILLYDKKIADEDSDFFDGFPALSIAWAEIPETRNIYKSGFYQVNSFVYKKLAITCRHFSRLPNQMPRHPNFPIDGNPPKSTISIPNFQFRLVQYGFQSNPTQLSGYHDHFNKRRRKEMALPGIGQRKVVFQTGMGSLFFAHYFTSRPVSGMGGPSNLFI